MLLLTARESIAQDKFPGRLQGFWGDSKETCNVLRTKGPAYLRKDQLWLKISPTDVLGSTLGRFLRETPARMVNRDPAAFSFEIQTLDERRDTVDLTLSIDGHLYETIVGFRASQIYQRCN